MMMMQLLPADLDSMGTLLPGGWELPLRLSIDIVCVLVLVRGIYFRIYRRAEYLLTLISFNLVIFLITWMLNSVEMTMGAAFGLFAVFSMLRFRTEGIATSDMTYLFLSIALGLLMSVNRGGWGEMAIVAVTLLLGTWILESQWFARRERSRSVLYDNLALVAEGNQENLLADLRTRTGLPVHRVEVKDVDLLKDVVTLRVYLYEDIRKG